MSSRAQGQGSDVYDDGSAWQEADYPGLYPDSDPARRANSSSQTSIHNDKQRRSASGSAATEISGGSSTSSSSSINAAMLSKHASRARVSMACIHCRQRKIRCDGNQPTCSTCVRLGRFCVYESISEIENSLTRDRKKRSKEAKQARLHSLAGLGIPMPTQPLGVTPMSSSPISPGLQTQPTGYSPSPHRPFPFHSASMGAIRDSRLSKEGRHRPYMAVYPQQSPLLQQQPNQGTLPVGGFQEREMQMSSVPPCGRRRMVTVDGYNTQAVDQSAPLYFDAESTNRSTPLNSLSQPTTPEATYSMHASMLSQDLSRNQSQSPGEIIASSLPMSSIPAPAPDYDPASAPAFGHPAFAPYVPTPDLPSFALPSSVQARGVSVTFSDLEQQIALRRRSSFDVGDFWRRASVADAAVASFFDRVIQARETRKGSFRGDLPAPSHPQFPTPLSTPSQPVASPSESQIPNYSGLQEVMRSATPLEAPYAPLDAAPFPPSFAHPFQPDEGATMAGHQQRSPLPDARYKRPSEADGYQGFYRTLAPHLQQQPLPLSMQAETKAAPRIDLSNLPDFQLAHRPFYQPGQSVDGEYRTPFPPHHSASTNTSTSSNNGSPNRALNSSHEANGVSGQSIYFSPNPSGSNPLATPVTELSSDLFAMAPPSTAASPPTTASYNEAPFLSSPAWGGPASLPLESLQQLNQHQHLASRQDSLSSHFSREESGGEEGRKG